MYFSHNSKSTLLGFATPTGLQTPPQDGRCGMTADHEGLRRECSTERPVLQYGFGMSDIARAASLPLFA